MVSDLKRKVMHGIAWTGFGRIGSAAFKIVALLILAKLLAPEMFGQLALAMVVVRVINAVVDRVVAAALVQKNEVAPIDYDSAFWLNLGQSVVFAAILISSANWVASWLNAEELSPVLMVLAIMLPLSAWGTIPCAILRRELRFSELAKRDVLAEFLFGFVAIIAGVCGCEIWSLVIGYLVRTIVRSTIVWRDIDWRPKMRCSIDSLRTIQRFVTIQTLSVVAIEVLATVDIVVVGQLMGTSALGLYALAAQFALSPARQIANSIKPVVFPAFARTQENQEQMRRGYLKLLKYLLLINNALALLVSFGSGFIVFIYGKDWVDARIPMLILSLGMCLYSLEVTDQILLSVGRVATRLTIFLIRTMLFLGMVWFFHNSLSLELIAIAVFVSSLISAVVLVCFVNQITQTSLSELIRAIGPPVVVYLVLIVCGWGILRFDGASPLASLVVGILGSLFFLAVLIPLNFDVRQFAQRFLVYSK